MTMLPDVLVSMFPPVNASVKNGELTVDTAKQAWAEIAGQFDPSPAVVILYGSILEGRAKPYSDIDLLLVSQHGDVVRRRPIFANGYLFDITLFPRHIATHVATEASRSLGPGRITPFLSGQPIAGSQELFEELRQEVQRIYAQRIGNQRHLLASMENNLLGMLSDASCTAEAEIVRCIGQEAKFVALNILSIREFGELLPPSIMIRKSDAALRQLIIGLLDYPLGSGDDFPEFVIRNVGFQEIKGWEA